jgi:hypothetical protein
VGSSSLALLATALAPALAPAAAPRLGRLVEIVTVDADTIDPSRNPFRYPAPLGSETGLRSRGRHLQ